MPRKQWRKLVKKLQRKRRRQKSAKERDQFLNSENEGESEDFQLSELQLFAQERQHQEAEEAWLRRELLAQQQFRLVLKQRAEQEAEQDAKIKQQEQEYNKREVERQRLVEQKQHSANLVAAEFERTMERLEEYLENVNEIAAPPELRRFVDTKPGQKLCEFYERTNCCRFGAPCCFNHRRPLLSTIILIRHFFTHPLMEQSGHTEYDGGESLLELSERDLRTYYDAFFADVVPEMESFGKLLNFRVASNVLPHLRGHVFVEYTEERSALKAFISLQGRYYATKRLNVEFSNLRTWRGAVCGFFGDFSVKGLSLIRKCGKGQQCNYLHLFRNPDNKYNTLLEYTNSGGTSSRSSTSCRTPVVTPTPSLSWNDTPKKDTPRRNWRWSESPEPELVPSSSNATKHSPERKSTAKQATERNSTPTSRLNSERSSSKSEDKEKYDSKQGKQRARRDHKKSHHKSSKREHSRSRHKTC